MADSSITLVETSFADAIRLIDESQTLTNVYVSHWTCSLRQIAKALDRPLELVPGRWTSIRIPISRLHHARLGLTAKSLSNHKANVRAALRWLSGEQGLPTRGAPLDPLWAKLRDGILDKGLRARLYGLMRFASAKGIAPTRVDDALLTDFLRYRAETTARRSDAAAMRSIARSWNRCVETIAGWPAQRLIEPPPGSRSGELLWEDVPEGLRRDVQAYLETLTHARRTAGGKRVRAAKASTIRTRRAELRAFVGKAVAIGIPLQELTSLKKLLHPDISERVINAYRNENGEEPKTYTIELGWKILAIARQIGLDEEALEALDELRYELEEYRRLDLTEKNLAVIRQVLATSIWREVCLLPGRLMNEARELHETAPVKAALRAQLAVAIGILTVAPVRLGNLTRIRLGENLIRPGGPRLPYGLVFPNYDVKNRVRLEFNLKAGLTGLIEEYLRDHQPVLLRGSKEPWLFPGDGAGHKTPSMFGQQITDIVEKRVGIRVTAHQYRHAAAAIILKTDNQNYEWARRVLGHKNLQTTINFYTGLEMVQASERFGDVIRSQIEASAGAGAWSC
jgi:integrase